MTPTPTTPFSRDITGRYLCNTLGEALDSGPFDVVIVGGGTFGLSLAQDLFERSRAISVRAVKPANYRILVLEAGPLALPQHVQDVPNLQLASPGPIKADPGTLLDAATAPRPSAGNPLPATRQELVQAGLDRPPLFETWGLPWNASVRFGGLAYCLGGRSLYFGGWSPQYLDTEMDTAPSDPVKSKFGWPLTVVDDLKNRFLFEAAKQTGVTTSNDFINGKLHDYYRKTLFGLYAGIPSGVPLSELPDYSAYASPGLQAQVNKPPYTGFKDSLKLDAPLAVQIETRPGFFPFNKFSSVPLALTAARQAFTDSGNNDANKRLMIVPNCHVKRLQTRSYTLATGATAEEVVGIETGERFIDLSRLIAGNPNRHPVVVLALGAIESARVAIVSLGGLPTTGLMGANLMVHLRKNVQFTAPLPAGLGLSDTELTALLVRTRSTVNGTPVHMHFQITAAALPGGSGAGSSDALLFRNVPDLDNLRHFSETAPGEVDVSIRAVGEMLPNPGNAVRVPLQPADPDEYGVPRASVSLAPRTSAAAGGSDLESQVIAKMDQVIDHLAKNLFGAATSAGSVQPDGLGTTFHESGTLRMGDAPAQSVVNADGQFHFVANLYAGDAAVLPTCGSANPVMNGIALRRRLAKTIVPEGDADLTTPAFTPYSMPATGPAKGTVLTLFDGKSLQGWRMAGRGTFLVVDGCLQSIPSFDLGLLWCTTPMPRNYRLELEFFIRSFETNSGVFIRFRHPDSTGFSNPAWSAVYMPNSPSPAAGFEVQIDNTGAAARPQAQGLAKHRTGAVYAVNYPGDPTPDPQLPKATPGDFVSPQDAQVLAWNQYAIEVQGNVILVSLNGSPTARYTNTDSSRGQFSASEATFVGLQSYSNYGFTTAFRNIRATVI